MIQEIIFVWITIGFLLFFVFIEEGARTSIAWLLFWPILFFKLALLSFIDVWNDIY